MNQSQAALRRVGERATMGLFYREMQGRYSALRMVSKSRMQTVVKMMS